VEKRRLVTSFARLDEREAEAVAARAAPFDRRMAT